MTETVIKLKNVNKKFGNLTAVNNVSLEIKKGENKEEYVFEFYNEEKLKIKKTNTFSNFYYNFKSNNIKLIGIVINIDVYNYYRG